MMGNSNQESVTNHPAYRRHHARLISPPSRLPSPKVLGLPPIDLAAGYRNAT